MNRVLIEDQAARQIQDIYLYTASRWDVDQAVEYVQGLTDAFDAIASHAVTPRRIATEFEIDGSVHRFRRHLIYRKRFADDSIGIFAVLHERQHQSGHLNTDRS